MWQKTIIETRNNRYQQTQTSKAKAILAQYAQNNMDIVNSNELKFLFNISCKKELNYSLHAQELYNMIRNVCEHETFTKLDKEPIEIQLRIKDNCARLHMFLTMLVTLSNSNHRKFTAILEPVIHELSLLIHEITLLDETNPVVKYDSFNQAHQHEFLGNRLGEDKSATHENRLINLIRQYTDISVRGYPANSGMHAHLLGLYICKILLSDINNRPSLNFYEKELHYYEQIKVWEKLLLSQDYTIDRTLSDIHIINGSVMDGFTPYIKGENLNQFVNKLSEDGHFIQKKHTLALIDITNTDYNQLKLNDSTQKLINMGCLTVILWESWQKMGLLGTDQAQYGRVVVLTCKSHLPKLADITNKAKIDILKLDMQIGSLFQICRQQYNRYREFNFINGETLRFILSGNVDQVGPFLVNDDVANALEFFPILLRRDSFGFNLVTATGKRISAGSEHNIDIKIFSFALKKIIGYIKTMNTPDHVLGALTQELNNYFRAFKLNLSTITQDDTINLMANLYLVEVIFNVKKQPSFFRNLHNVRILEICNVILQENNKNIYDRFVHECLKSSKQALAIVISVKKIMLL